MFHVHLDQSGQAWIEDTNVKVIEVVLNRQAQKMSPEEIHEQYPHLSLAQIHGALSYYYDHQSELDEEIERRYREVERMRGEAANQPTREQLQERLQTAEHQP